MFQQFEEDLQSRSQQLASVLKTGRELQNTVPAGDADAIAAQCQELQTAWERLTRATATRADRLDAALKEVYTLPPHLK